MVRTNEHDGLTYDNGFMVGERGRDACHTYIFSLSPFPSFSPPRTSAFHGWKILGFGMMARYDISDSQILGASLPATRKEHRRKGIDVSDRYAGKTNPHKCQYITNYCDHHIKNDNKMHITCCSKGPCLIANH
jgi:hypothetical protein